jgi:hypothetical protein
MRFPTIFRIALYHDYSRDGFCHGLELVPSASTKAMMKRLGMILKVRDGKYEMLAETVGDEQEVRFLPTDIFHFNFFLALKNPLFFNCTDLPLSSLNRFPAFSNLNGNKKSPLFLHQSETAGADDMMEQISLNGNLPIFEEGKAIVKNEVGEVVYEMNAKPPVLPVHLSEQGNGKYTIELSGKRAGYFYACDISFGLTIRGAIDIWHHPQVPAEASFVNADGTIAAKEYEVHFGSRKTYWNYFLTGSSLSRYQSLAITDTKRDVFFTGPQEKKLFNGKEGLLFTSPEPLYLKEESENSFQLRRNCTQGGNAGFPVIERLPMANPELLLQPEKGNENGIYSEIIVYL